MTSVEKDAREAVAIVLSGMMKPSEAMCKAGTMALVYPGIGDTAMVRPLLNANQAEQVFQAMLRAFAAEHGISPSVKARKERRMITEEMVKLHDDALHAALDRFGDIVGTKGAFEAKRAALEAVVPMILEEAAKVADDGWRNKDGPMGDAIRALAPPTVKAGEGE